MFQTVPLSIIRSFSLYTQQWYMSYSLRAGSRWNCSSLLILLESCQQTRMTIPMLCVQWKTPDDGQRNCPKHVVSIQNKFVKLEHLVGFIRRIFSVIYTKIVLHVWQIASWIYWLCYGSYLCIPHTFNSYISSCLLAPLTSTNPLFSLLTWNLFTSFCSLCHHKTPDACKLHLLFQWVWY